VHGSDLRFGIPLHLEALVPASNQQLADIGCLIGQILANWSHPRESTW
jgi:hypothetical protein